MNHTKGKVDIEYPCLWLYKIIGTEKGALISAVNEIFTEAAYTLTFSNTSSKGKYLSFNLEVSVPSEEARNFYYNALKQHPAIKMVL